MLNLITKTSGNLAQETNPTILIIEDSVADRVLMSSQIASEWIGAQVIYTEYLSEAYMICRDTHIDLFILDLHLPDAFGAQTVESLRKFERHSPIIAVTSSEEEIVLSRADSNGATAVLKKSKLMSDDFVNILKYHYKNSKKVDA